MRYHSAGVGGKRGAGVLPPDVSPRPSTGEQQALGHAAASSRIFCVRRVASTASNITRAPAGGPCVMSRRWRLAPPIRHRRDPMHTLRLSSRRVDGTRGLARFRVLRPLTRPVQIGQQPRQQVVARLLRRVRVEPELVVLVVFLPARVLLPTARLRLRQAHEGPALRRARQPI